jgi:SAM-dependent methyltransferase
MLATSNETRVMPAMTVRNRGAARADPIYALGHSDRELARLDAQERLVGPITRQFLQEAGIDAGMRVLDVGSGAGHVSFLAADLVGETGEVIGADNAPAAIAAARARAKEASRSNVEFREGNPTEMEFEQPFDAIVGRYVLMFQADHVAMLRKLARKLRPGGLIVFHEPDWGGACSLPPSPLYDRCHRWIIDTFLLLGIEPRMGVKLHEAFIAAELPAPTMRLMAIIRSGVGGSDWIDQIAELVRTLLPTMEQLKVARPSEVEIETLGKRIHREIEIGGGVIVGRSEIGGWSRVQVASADLNCVD